MRWTFKAAMAASLLLVLATFACAPVATPTPTPAPTPTATRITLRAEALRLVDTRQLTTEGEGIQALLWWSEGAREFILSRDLSRQESLRRTRGKWDSCGKDYARGSYVWRVRADGQREFLAESLDSPSVSPDGRYLVYTYALRCDNEERFARSLVLMDLRNRGSRSLVEAAGAQVILPPWAGGGSAAFLVARGDGIWSVDTATGALRKLNDLVAPATGTLVVIPSPDGKRLAYSAGSSELWVMDMDGGNRRRIASEAQAWEGAWSPDGSRLAYLPGPKTTELRIATLTAEGVLDKAVSLAGELTGGFFGGPSWSPDGDVIALPYLREGDTPSALLSKLYVLNSDGTGFRQLAAPEFRAFRVWWSGDGRALFLPALKQIYGGLDLWALALDERAAGQFLSEPVSLYVRADPAPVAPNRYVYLEAKNVSNELRLGASPIALAQEGMTRVHTRQELERAVGPETRAVVLNREGVGEVDPAWVRQQYEAGRPIWGVWVSGDELKDLLDAQAPMSLYKYTPGRSFLRGYLEKNPEGKPSYGGGEGTLQGDRLTLYRLMDEISSHGLSLRDIMNAPRRPGAPTSTPTPSPTPTYDLACPTSPQLSSFSVPLSDADAVRKAVLSGCYAAPGRDVRLQATKATITSTTWREFRPNLGDTAHSYPDDEPLAIVTLTGIEGYDYYQVVMSRRTGGIFHEALHPGPPPFLSGATPTPTTTFAPTRRPTPTPAASPMLPIWTIPTPTMTPTPIGYPISCQPGATTAPCGSGAVVGQPYSYRLYTHCGIHQAYFDGRWWVASPRLDDGNLNPPPGWGNPQDTGVMMLVQVDRARFTNTGGLSADFRPAPPSYQPEGCY